MHDFILLFAYSFHHGDSFSYYEFVDFNKIDKNSLAGIDIQPFYEDVLKYKHDMIGPLQELDFWIVYD